MYLSKKICRLLPVLILLSGIAGIFTQQPVSAVDEAPGCDLSVFADPNDPYAGLAHEIAAAEGVEAVNSMHEALSCEPETILWVTSPAFLSEQKIIEADKYFGRLENSPMIGIITGSTEEQARALWQRGSQDLQPERLYAANAYSTAAHIDAARLLRLVASGFEIEPLMVSSLQNALSTADYLTFTGHGGNTFLGLDDDTNFTTDDVPELDGGIVATGSCSTIQIWRENNIALRFVDQGASAYVGFVFSPNEGYLQGEFTGLPFRYTWPDFPIGEAALLQARGAMQGYGSFMYLYMLGDPRLSLQTQNQFNPVEDTYQGSGRTVRYENLPAGMIPIRVKSGAAYEYVRIISDRPTSASDDDLFYNSRVQMRNRRGYKYLLIDHPGGDLTLKFSDKPPIGWSAADLVLDSIDHTLLFGQDHQGDVLDLFFSIIPGVWLVVMLVKRKISRAALITGVLVGLAFTVLYGFYAVLRLDQISITTKMVEFKPLSLAGLFLTTGMGAVIYMQSRRLIGKVLGAVAATFSTWALALFTFGINFAVNMAFNQRYGHPALNNFASATLGLIAFLVELAVLGGLIYAVRRSKLIL